MISEEEFKFWIGVGGAALMFIYVLGSVIFIILQMNFDKYEETHETLMRFRKDNSENL